MLLIDLFNQEIIGFSADSPKTSLLVKQAFQSINSNIKNIQVFHMNLV